MIGAIFGVLDVDDGVIHRIWLHGYVETKSTVVAVSESIAMANGRWYKCRHNSRGSGQERGEEYGDGGAHGGWILFIIFRVLVLSISLFGFVAKGG